MDLCEILQIMVIFNVLHVFWYLIPYHLCQELTVDVCPQLSQILNIMILGKRMPLLNNPCGVRREQIQLQKDILDFLRIFLFISITIFRLDIVTESPANSQRIIEIIAKLPAIYQHRERDILLLFKGILNDPSNDLQCLILTILQHHNRDVPVLIEDKVELKLREGGMQFVEGNEWSSCCLDFLEGKEDEEQIDNFSQHYTCYLRLQQRQMVKKTKKQFVWEKVEPKVRKIRIKRVKDKGNDVVSAQQGNCDGEEDSKMHEDVAPQQNMEKSIEIEHPGIEKKPQAQPQPQEAILPTQPNYEEMRKQLKERLAIIKQILYNEQYAESSNNNPDFDNYRDFQCQEIITFLNHSDPKSTQNFNILYIYGSPGIGKTFTLKRMLSHQKWQGKVKWINCLTMLNKSLLRYVQPLSESSERKQILIIDQFDQMQKQFKNIRFIHSFKAYLKEILNKSFIPSLPDIRFVLISNKSYQSISQDFIQSIKNLIKFDSITEVPFLPYTPSDILKILKNKAEAIHTALKITVFTDTFLQLTSKRQFSKSQDIRKVINYIYNSYQNKQLKRLTDGKKQVKAEVINEERGLDAETIVNMTGRQKNLFKILLDNHEKFAQRHEPLLSEFIYHQGSKMTISKGCVDIWLTEWSQSGLITLKPFQKEGHYLYKTKQILTHLPFKSLLRYFY